MIQSKTFKRFCIQPPATFLNLDQEVFGLRILENDDVGRDILDDVALVGSVENDEVLFAELLLEGEAAAEDPVADDPNI